MFGLAVDTDLADLVGCRLESVSVSPHQVDLNLDGMRNIAISVEGDFAVTRPGEREVRYSSAPDGALALIALLDDRVVSAIVVHPGRTVVTFAGGAVVSIFDSETSYESYQIHIGRRLIVV